MNAQPCSFSIALPVTLLALALATAAVQGQAKTEPEKKQEITHQKNHFQSRGAKIRLERFRLAGKGDLPVMILVPESKSMNKDPHVRASYEAIAERMAEDGYEVFIVQFFDRTGDVDGVKPEDFKDPKRGAEMKKKFQAWMETVADCVSHVRTLKGVQKDRVGMIGFSLGGFLALSVVSDKEVKVRAVASYSGGLPDELCGKVTHLPPTFVVHGNLDSVVPVRNALTVIGKAVCLKTSCEHELCNDGHLFQTAITWQMFGIMIREGKDFDLKKAFAEVLRTNATVEPAVRRTLAFFDKHVKGGKGK
ncbi:MAG: dienelactone hydrolase family protein [Gemmataceae bacterium]